MSDLTYIWTGEGWLYLAVIINLFSRRVVGWSMAEHMQTELVLTALQAALGQRSPAIGKSSFLSGVFSEMPIRALCKS